MIKKRQYHIWQYDLKDLIEEEGQLILYYKLDDITNVNESLLYYILHKEIMGLEHNSDLNILPIMTIESGRGRTKQNNEKLKNLLTYGFTANLIDVNGEVTRSDKYLFLDNTMSGSQNKECRQIFVMDKYHSQLKEYVSLGVEPKFTSISRNLTRNALATTDVYLVPVDIEKLNICIIQDFETTVIEDVEMIQPYDRTEEEEKQYAELIQCIEAEKEYFNQVAEIRKLANESDSTYPIIDKPDWETHKTSHKWFDVGFKVKESQIKEPFGRFKNSMSTFSPLYSQEQVEELVMKDIPINEWTTGLKLQQLKDHEVELNVFDGMGLVSKELGQYFEQHLQTRNITGYQLRMPGIKGFFPVVDFRSYYKKHGINTITDLWGNEYKVSDVDIIMTESCFKTKLEYIINEDGTESKHWLFDINQYKQLLIKYGYDVIGISNVNKPIIKDEYRQTNYQLLLALDLRLQDLLALSNTQGDLIHKALSIYREDEINWDNLKYIYAFLNLVQRDNKDNGIGKDATDAIKAIKLNKMMVFDKKVINLLQDNIERMIDDMALGKMYVKSNYLYIVRDIISFLRYAGAKDKANWTYSGFLKEKQFYCKDKHGNYVMARNPIMSFSEITRANFVDYVGDDLEFINHLDNIVQMPLGTETVRLSGADYDGDQVMLIETENIRDTKINYLQNYNLTVDEEGHINYGKNMLDELNNKIQQHFKDRFGDKEVAINDYVVDSLVQVNSLEGSNASSKDWNIDNIIDFIIISEDRTGVITDVNSVIENVANEEQDLQKYKLPIAIMKNLQALMIDASKTGLFDEVVVPDVIKYKYGRKKPLFMYYKDGREFNKDYSVISALDKFSLLMKRFKEKHVDYIFNKKITKQIKRQRFFNVVSLMQNNNINPDVVKQTIDDLQDLYKRFIERNRDLAIKKSSINPYASDDKTKRQREQINQEFTEFYKEVKAEAEAICSYPSLLATASVRMTYIDSKSTNQNSNYSFCWVVASEGILYNLKQNEDLEKVMIAEVDESLDDSFKWLGSSYKSSVYVGEYDIEFKNDMSLPSEFLNLLEEDLEPIENLEVTLLKNGEWNPEELAEKIKGNSYELYIDNDGYIGVVDGVSIERAKELEVRSYIGRHAEIKEIVSVSKRSLKVKMDIA